MTLRTPSLSALAVIGLLAATPTSAAPELARFSGEAKVSRFTDDNCMIDSGKVAVAILESQPIVADKKGCLTIKGTDGKPYFVSRPKKKIECREMASNTVTTVTAGSAAANESCKRK